MGAQCKRVSRALDRHPGGVCQVDFLLPNVIDGGEPITRLAARVKDLRDAGETIEVVGERYGCAVYARAKSPAQPVAAAVIPPVVTAAPSAQRSLFELAPQSAIFDADAAA